MADDPNKKGSAAEKPGDGVETRGTAYFAKNPMPDVPPSKPLQWFLLGAFVLTGAAYLVGQWTERANSPAQIQSANKLRRLVQNQSEYLAHCKLGDAAFAKKQYDQAASEYRIALQSQDNPEGHEHLGQALLKKGDPDMAIAQFKESLRLDPAYVNSASAWGQALAAQGKPDEAAHVFQAALKSNPDSGLLHYNLATTLLDMRVNAEGRRRMAAGAGKSQEAQAAEIQAKNLADEALLHFTKASRNKVDSAAFWLAYGQLLNELGQYTQAETALLRSVSEDTGVPAAQFQLALADHHTGKYAEAIAHYEKALTLTPDNTDTLNGLALLYATATNAEVRTSKMAVQLATRACDATSNQNARYMDTLARCYAADGDFFQAISWEDKAVHRAMQLNEQDLARELQGRQARFMNHKNP